MEKEFNEKNALQLIESMIHSVKEDIRDNGFFFMLWGWLVFSGALMDYFLLMSHNPYHAMVWAILMPAGGIVSIIAGVRSAKKPAKVTTYIDALMKNLVTAFVISLLVVCFIMPWSGNLWRGFFPVLMVLYAIFLFISGGALQFRPLVIGGLLNWGTAALAFFMKYDVQLLLLAFAVASGYIVPGHIMQYRFNKNV